MQTTTTQFIQLNRTFTDFDPSATGERDDDYFSLGSLYSGTKTWTDILKNGCTVILAEAGQGKTTELKAQAAQLRRDGEAAFLCLLGMLADSALDQALEIGTDTELAGWMHSAAHGYFFLDSVDEARLANPKDFEKAIVRLAETIEPYKDRVTVVISTRPHAWQAQADVAMLSRRLAFPTTMWAPDFETESSDQDDLDGGLEVGAAQKVSKKDAPSIAIVQMTPLSEEQIRNFAKARGVTDLDSFIEAIERADADAFANRPADLPALINSWMKNGRIGRYSEVVENNVKLKLSEENPAHAQSSPIAEDRAYQGAEALAVAVTLTKRTQILLPDRVVDPELLKKSFDPREVLAGWTPSEIQALLGRALFDEALYGTVRFHHRTAREYLTARWFGRLLKNQKNRRQVERLFFAKPYGVLPEVVVPTLKPVVGWLAVLDQRVRDRLLRVDPKVLLEYGDASALDIGARATLLKDFAAQYENRNHTPVRLHIREIRRLSDQGLAGPIRDLLEKYRAHVDVRQLLLRIIREGNVPDCGPVALLLATDDTADAYTRSCAVQAIGTAATTTEKKDLGSTILASAATLDRGIISAAVETLWPSVLSDADVMTLLEVTPAPKPFSSDTLDHQVTCLVDKLKNRERVQYMLRAFVDLLSRPPLHNENYARISKRYDWLVTVIWKLMFKLSTMQDNPETSSHFLAGLSICTQAEHLQRYAGDVHKEATQLIRDNDHVRHALFWHECTQTRARSEKPIRNWWSAISSPSYFPFDEAETETYLEDLRQRTNSDDRLVALSVLTTLVGRSDQKLELLDRIKGAIHGDVTLEAALTNHLTPNQPSQEQTEWEARAREAGRERDEREKEAEQARKQWISNLREKPDLVGDLTSAAEGKVWRNTVWLIQELADKQDNNSRLSQSRWEDLEPDFGTDVAKRFHDFCQAFWRRYTPQLRSEAGGDSSPTPWAVIIGLSGLAMEAWMDPEWATRLTGSQPELVTRYALWELNALPGWFLSLYETHPLPVKKILLREIEWEFDRPQPAGGSSYVLSRLRWTAQRLGEALRSDLIQILESRPHADTTPLTEALTVILRDPSLLPETFRDAVAQHAEAASSEVLEAIWLSALLCLDADRAISAIETWVDTGEDAAAKERRISLILNHIWGDRVHNLNSHHQNFMKVDVLLRLLKLAHSHVRIEDDVIHEEAWSPGVRDHAQQARGHVLELLVGIPGRSTFDALVELSKFHSLEYPKNRMLNLAEQRAEADADLSEWKPEDVANFKLEVEREPTSQKDLYQIGLSRLDDIKLDLEEGDESEASLWRKAADEIELRRVVANRLKLISQNKYTTGSEEELADKTRTDIRLHHPHVNARIPIEIKIAGKLRAKQHRERLENQLISQYMREAQYGIFLIINRGAGTDRKSWRIANKSCGFPELVQWLVGEVCQLLREHNHVQGLEVIGIDLTARDEAAVVTQKQRALKKKQREKASSAKLYNGG